MIDDIKRELRNRKGYERDLKDIELLIEAKWNDLRGVKGVRYDKPHSNPSEAVIQESRLQLIEEYNDLLNEKRRIQLQLDHIQKILEAIDDETREAVELYFCEGKTIRKTARLFDMSKSGLEKRINRELEKAEKRTRPL